MNRWKSYNKWVPLWGVSLLVSGVILYTGYQASNLGSVQEEVQQTSISTTQSPPAQLQQSSGNEISGQSEQPQKLPVNSNNTSEKVTVSALNSSKETEEIQVGLDTILGLQDSGIKGQDISDFPSPVKGAILRVIGNYYSNALGSYLFHSGTDYAEPEGTVIRATHGGKVVTAGPDIILGQQVTLDCGDGWSVTYGGLDNLSVRVGDIIKERDRLGQVGVLSGADGVKNQSQIHYEVWHNDKVQYPNLQNN